jgi:hypothetical protein
MSHFVESISQREKFPGSQAAEQRIEPDWHRIRQATDLTPPHPCGEDRVHRSMRTWKNSTRCLCLGVALLAAQGLVVAQDPPPPAPNEKVPRVRTDVLSRITIEVSGGEKDTPVENASVYVKYVEERKLAKDKKLELNVKTNRDGIAHVPNAPLGRVLIQVIAEGWKTYGRWYDITDTKQVFKIRLQRPPKWY